MRWLPRPVQLLRHLWSRHVFHARHARHTRVSIRTQRRKVTSVKHTFRSFDFSHSVFRRSVLLHQWISVWPFILSSANQRHRSTLHNAPRPQTHYKSLPSSPPRAVYSMGDWRYTESAAVNELLYVLRTIPRYQL